MTDLCPICYCEEENLFQLDCEHSFCNDCLVKYIETKINDNDNDFICHTKIVIHILDTIIFSLFWIQIVTFIKSILRWRKKMKC